MKKYLLTALALATLTFTSCSKDDDKIEDKVEDKTEDKVEDKAEKETPVNQEPIEDKAKAIVSVSTTSIEYYQVNIAVTKLFSLEVINTGTAKLEITSITLKGTDKSEFSVDGTLTSIEAGKKESIIVNFKPNNTGVRNASLEIVTNVGTKTVTLKGTGKATVSESDRVKKALRDNSWISGSNTLQINVQGVLVETKANGSWADTISNYTITSISSGSIHANDSFNKPVVLPYTLNTAETSFVINFGTGNITYIKN